jgi:hypothetical protein
MRTFFNRIRIAIVSERKGWDGVWDGVWGQGEERREGICSLFFVRWYGRRKVQIFMRRRSSARADII